MQQYNLGKTKNASQRYSSQAAMFCSTNLKSMKMSCRLQLRLGRLTGIIL